MINLSVRLLAILLAGILLLGVALGLGWQQLASRTTAVAPMHKVEKLDPKPRVLYWYDPMVPDKHFDKPGPSPFMDMQLVPKYAAHAAQEPGLGIAAGLVQNLGMRTAKVQRLPVQMELEVSGKLQFNERNQAVVQLRAGGFAEKVWPLAVGDRVIAGEPIAEFHIPEWLDAQNELLSQPAGNPHVLKTLRTRLQLLGMPDTLIARLEKTRQPEPWITITAPISGVVDILGVKTGMALASGDTLVRIHGIDNVWLDAAIPEAQASQLQPGATAAFYSANPNDPVLLGRLETLLPSLNESSRTLTARILLDNPGGLLKPGSSGRVRLQNTATETALFVPTEAVIRTGQRVLVMLAEPGGQFRPVEVSVGDETGNQTLIREGLAEDQEVVSSGQFLLDSEASLLGIPVQALSQHGKELQP